MLFPPPLYLQLYSVWLVAESQRMMLQMFHNAMGASRQAVDTASDFAGEVAVLPAPIAMPHVDSTPV